MAGDLTTYAGRAKRRPPGASDFTQALYRLLHEHPNGMTVDEIHAVMREGWMDTDAYRAYAHHLESDRLKRAVKSVNHGAHGSQIRPRTEFGSPAFKAAAQRWAINASLATMRRLRTAQKKGEGHEARYFVGERAPRVQGRKSTYVPFNPAESRAVLTNTNAEHISRENAKSELLALLNDKRVKGRTREGIQRAYDYLAGRTT